jgi:hypothetical protein
MPLRAPRKDFKLMRQPPTHGYFSAAQQELNVSATPKVSSATAIPKPRSVRAAMGLLWLSVALSVIELPAQWREISAALPLLPSAAMGAVADVAGVAAVFFLAFNIWLYLRISQGRNWARLTYLISAGLSVAFALSQLANQPDLGSASFWLSALDQCLALATIALLNTRASREWFVPPPPEEPR